MILKTVVLAGNPNCGKSVIFNILTGSRQRVGNWPGVTVEKKAGYFIDQQDTIQVVDLPGIYSLSVISQFSSVDEKIACDFLLSEEPSLIVNVVDAAHLERHLYLTLQLLETDLPLILAVNMMDVAHRRHLRIDLEKLSEILGCTVIPLVANKRQGIAQLQAAIVKQLSEKKNFKRALPFQWPEVIQLSVQRLTAHLTENVTHKEWVGLRLLEGDSRVLSESNSELRALSQTERAHVEEIAGEEADILMADCRYGFIAEIIKKIFHESSSLQKSITDSIDRIVLNQWLGLPIFFLMMYLMFLFSINIGGVFQDFFDMSSNTLFVDGLAHLLNEWSLPPWIVALVANGIGKGINTTLTFIPVIGGLFLFLSFLEDSGYMARGAFVMDRFMQAVGLPGKSFVPMIIGFGCNVPAVMAARTLSNPRDRILTVMMMPFMSCSARLAIFAVFVAAFFHRGGQNIIFSLYMIGILIAMLTGWILQKTVLKGESSALVMELPPYHLPTFQATMKNTWGRLKSFLLRASQVIIPVCMMLGLLNSITMKGELAIHHPSSLTLLSAVGKTATPIFKPMGITSDNWPATVGLMTGVLAKEVVIGTLNTLYSQAAQLENSTSYSFSMSKGLLAAVDSISNNFMNLNKALINPIGASEASYEMKEAVYGVMYQRFAGKAAAFSYLLLVLLYFPCVSTVAAMRREVGARWTWFSMGWNTILAYGVSVLVYQSLTFHQHAASSILWILGILSLFGGVIFQLKLLTRKMSSI